MLDWVNGWPAPRLPFAPIPMELNLSNKAADQVTIFVVYQPTGTESEQAVWTWMNNDQAELILTNQRLADIITPAYLNFTETAAHPQLSAYVHHQRKSQEAGQRQLLLGQKPTAPDLPITNWYGPVPEVVIYDRLLLPQERRQVESYLALKYGLTLRHSDKGVDYLDAQGNTIWNYEKHADFHHRILGIGRNHASNWQQRQSASALAPDLLLLAYEAIEANNWSVAEGLPDQSSLLAGDDNAPLTWSEEAFQLGAEQLDRHWIIESHNFPTSATTELRLETGRWDHTASASTYWLAIDRSGTGEFPLAETDYYPGSRETQGRFTHFEHVKWDIDQSSTDQFTFLRAGELLLQAEVHEAQCFPATDGGLQFKILGGAPPYRYRLSSNTSSLERSGAFDGNDLKELTDLPSGSYRFEAWDGSGRLVQKNFFLAPSDAPEVDLAGAYELPAAGPLVLQPGLLSPAEAVEWNWMGPDGFTSQEPTVELQQAGDYQLQIDTEGCRREYSFQVLGTSVEQEITASAYPNPLARGKHFQWQAHLPQEGHLQVTITSTQGQVLQTQQFEGDRYYTGQASLLEAGTYWLQLQFENHQQTLKIVVQ